MLDETVLYAISLTLAMKHEILINIKKTNLWQNV